MQFLDRTGVGTLWSMCKTKFALAGHTHNYAGSGSAGGSANSAISVVDYGQTSKTIQIGYAGSGITGEQIKYIAGYTTGSGDVNAKIKDVSKDALKAWLGLGSLAYSSSSIPTNLSQLNNDKGFVTGSVSGNTITINGVSTTFALAGHTHNSLAAVGNEQISATAYGSGLHFKPYYSSGGPTTYGNILEYTSTNTGGGQFAMEWTGSQTKSDGTDSNVGRVYYRSKRDCINGWTKWMALAYTNDIPTKLSQLTNDKGFVTGSVSGNTVTINGVSTTWTNTWRGIQDNLTSTSTSESLSANQGRILKGLVDGKANSSHTHSWSQISGAPATATRWPSWGEVTGKPGSFTPSSHTHDWSQVTGKPDIKSWSETKSYIDSKVDSASNIVTLKEYLQKQLDQFGLKVGCGVVSEKIDRTCYQAFETGASETVNKYIYDTVNSIKLDTETNISTQLSGSNSYFDIVFDKYFYYSGEFYDNNFQLLKRIGTVNSYIIGSDFMYTRNYENRKLYIYDKNLNTKTVDIPTSFGYINELLEDLGDDGILIRNKKEGKYSSLIYKDGVFKESDMTYTSACYNINGHLYNKDSLGTILTKNVAIKSNKKYLCKNGSLHLQLFTIKDLYNNKDYNISIPIELYQFSDLDRTVRNKSFGLILSSYAYDKDAIYYIVIYRE